jgi:integrase
VFSPEEVWSLVRAAAPEQDVAIYLTAAFTGLRMGELRALCWRDVDFPGSTLRVRTSYYAGALTTPKSGKVRSVPLAPDVAAALAKLGARRSPEEISARSSPIAGRARGGARSWHCLRKGGLVSPALPYSTRVRPIVRTIELSPIQSRALGA